LVGERGTEEELEKEEEGKERKGRKRWKGKEERDRSIPILLVPHFQP